MENLRQGVPKQQRAEIIPKEPDAGNAAEGKARSDEGRKLTHHIPLCALQSLTKTIMSKFFTTALGCLLSVGAFAQFKISGTVLDSKSNPLAGATIQLENTRGTTSDEQGYFQLKNVPAGQQVLCVRFIGFAN